MGVAILWKSRLQRTVAVSSTEAEYYAISEAAKDIKFVAQILQSMGIKISMPIIVHVDNVGAIFMAENASATQRTKHVDVRYHFVREFIEEGFIKIIFVKTVNNTADIFTKNVSGELYEKHKQQLVGRANENWNIEGRVLEDYNNVSFDIPITCKYYGTSTEYVVKRNEPARVVKQSNGTSTGILVTNNNQYGNKCTLDTNTDID
jgi:hypothetical protein